MDDMSNKLIWIDYNIVILLKKNYYFDFYLKYQIEFKKRRRKVVL